MLLPEFMQLCQDRYGRHHHQLSPEQADDLISYLTDLAGEFDDFEDMDDDPVTGEPQSLVETHGWSWEQFQAQVLHMSWNEWLQLRGTPATAWERFQEEASYAD